ncbi:MAG: type II toxin-antitoxin system RelE/ParE family toxin [Deltaproteobacteria bacterium]|nr:type II toxin-antitoxin system RelE/ParE family toxin [Deltaproteobacteria bacterium]
MKVRFLSLAEREVNDAVAWYNEQSDNLGREFLDELDRAVRRVVSFPISCPELTPGLRRCLLARFPYGIIYGVEDDTVVVVAVAHLHRKPNYWSDRT